jgi:hypothetical protein
MKRTMQQLMKKLMRDILQKEEYLTGDKLPCFLNS